MPFHGRKQSNGCFKNIERIDDAHALSSALASYLGYLSHVSAKKVGDQLRIMAFSKILANYLPNEVVLV